MILRTGKKTAGDGFTLPETLIVLMTLLIFVAMSISFFSKFSAKASLDGAARSVASALRTARSYAITKNEEYYVNFDTANSKFYITDSGGQVEEKRYALPDSIMFYRPGFPIPITFLVDTDDMRACFKPTGELSTKAGAAVFVAERRGQQKWKRVVVIITTGAVNIDEINSGSY